MDYSQPPIGTVIISALVAVVLQIVIAPAITVFGVVPNIVMIVVIINAMHNGPLRSTILGFILGLFMDFCSLGPIGAMALVLTILAYAVSSLNKGFLTGGILVDMVIMIAAVAAGEFLVSVVYAVVGANPEFLFSLVQRVLPGIVYDVIIGLLLLLAYNALVKDKPAQSGMGSGRSITRKINM